MGAAMTIGLVAGGLAGASSLMDAERTRKQQKAQASAMSAQAKLTRNQAKVAEARGRVEAENIERQKSALRREFETLQGRNRVELGAGNVDMASGSALDVSLGNIGNFAADMGETAYQKALKEWESAQSVRNLNWQADQYDAQGSYLRRTAGNFGTSLLTAALSGVSTGLGAYSMAGGTFGDSGLSGLFGKKPGAMGVSTTKSLAHPDNLIPNYSSLYRGG